jgi:NADPH:quinone reductase
MRAFVVDGFDAAPALRDDIPAPSPGEGQVLVRVRSSSVNAVDRSIAAGMLKDMFEHEFPVILGRDFAGVVEEIGPGVSRYAAGDEVYGFLLHANPAVHEGSWSELIVVPEDNFVARKPRVDFATAGAAPLAGITALAAVDALELSDGKRLLVVGASGGVGSLAVQLAVKAGATVIAPGLPEDDAYLRELGVSEVLDRNADIAAAVLEHHPDGVDALLDLVSYAPDGFDAHAAALKEGGRGASPIGAAGEGPARANIMAVPSPENLERVARLLDDGTLRVPLHDSFRLDQAGEALEAFSALHKQGKLGIAVT